MTLTPTYDTVLSRVQLAATLLGAGATYAVFDRTTDAVNYTTVRGASHVTVTAQNASAQDFEFPAGVATTYRVRSYNGADVLQSTQTVVNTQDLTAVWFKSISRAFLNQSNKVTEVGTITRPFRGGLFDVIGRSFPVVVSDVRGSKQLVLQVNTITDAQRDNFDYLLASGDPVFVHVPSTNVKVQSGYFAITNSSEALVGIPSDQRFFDLSLTEVAAPTAEVVPVTITWQGVKNLYPTWTALKAANATWTALKARTGVPSDVIIP